MSSVAADSECTPDPERHEQTFADTDVDPREVTERGDGSSAASVPDACSYRANLSDEDARAVEIGLRSVGTFTAPDGAVRRDPIAREIDSIIRHVDNALEQARRVADAWFSESDTVAKEVQARRRVNLSTHLRGSYDTAFRLCLNALRKLPPGTAEPRERPPREHPDPVGDVATGLEEIRDWAKHAHKVACDALVKNIDDEWGPALTRGQPKMLEPTVKMRRRGKLVTFSLNEVDERRQQGWSVDDATFVATGTRVTDDHPTFQDCDREISKNAAPSRDEFEEVLETIRDSRKVSLLQTYWDSYALTQITLTAQTAIIATNSTDHPDVAVIQPAAAFVWRSLHDYSGHNIPDHVAPPPPELSRQSIRDLLLSLREFLDWLKRIEGACGHYLGLPSAADRLRADIKSVADRDDADRRLREAALNAPSADGLADASQLKSPKNGATSPATHDSAEAPRRRRKKGEANKLVAKYIAENAYRDISLRLLESETGLSPSTASQQRAWEMFSRLRTEGGAPAEIASAMNLLRNPDALKKLIDEQTRDDRTRRRNPRPSRSRLTDE